jgi:hypothetical protein
MKQKIKRIIQLKGLFKVNMDWLNLTSRYARPGSSRTY